MSRTTKKDTIQEISKFNTHCDNKWLVDVEQSPGGQPHMVVSNLKKEQLCHLVGTTTHGADVQAHQERLDLACLQIDKTIAFVTG